MADQGSIALEQALSRITDEELKRNERYGHVVLALFAGLVAVGTIGMIFEVPLQQWRGPLAVPAAWLIAVLGLAWAGWALVALLRPRTAPANREIVTGLRSVAFALTFTIGAGLASTVLAHRVFAPMTWLGLILTAMACALLLRAHLRRASLRRQKARLEQELASARG